MITYHCDMLYQASCFSSATSSSVELSIKIPLLQSQSQSQLSAVTSP